MAHYFDEKSMLAHFDGDEEILAELAEQFLASKDRLIDDIDVSIKGQDSKKLQISAHTLKGVCSNFYANSVKDLCFELETLGKNSKVAESELVFQRLKSEYEKFCSELDLYFKDRAKAA